MIFWLPLKYDISTEEAEKVQREIARQWVLYGSLFITNAPRGMGITFLDPSRVTYDPPSSPVDAAVDAIPVPKP